MGTFSLTSCQQQAFNVLDGMENVFLTGVAGSGKSFLLQRFLDGKTSKDFPVVASTGAAAVLIRGVTFHSFFGLGIMEGGRDKTIEKALSDRRVKKRLNRALAVIVDEISMIPGLALETAEAICRKARLDSRPWGGLKIIVVGDFGQLPPVTKREGTKDWAFLNPVWEQSQFRTAYLKTVMRSQDSEFLEVLNQVREGNVTSQVHDFLNSKMRSVDESFRGTRLFPLRHSVEDYNLSELSKLSGDSVSYATEYGGSDKYLEAIRRAAPVPETLTLKKKALVMVRKNDPHRVFVNGSLGVIQELHPDRIELELLGGSRTTLEKETYSYLDAEGNEVAWAKNFPVNLAWATTIHKSQGMTLDSALLDLSSIFEAGQAYVALSRVSKPEHLYISQWSARRIRSCEEVKKFHNHILGSVTK